MKNQQKNVVANQTKMKKETSTMATIKTKAVQFFKNPLTIRVMAMAAFLTIFTATHVYAAAGGGDAGMAEFDKVIGAIAKWVGRIGLVVAFFGGIQTALGFKNDDADAKIRGMQTLAAGFLVFGLSKSLSLFGLEG